MNLLFWRNKDKIKLNQELAAFMEEFRETLPVLKAANASATHINMRNARIGSLTLQEVLMERFISAEIQRSGIEMVNANFDSVLDQARKLAEGVKPVIIPTNNSTKGDGSEGKKDVDSEGKRDVEPKIEEN